jgi:hypothetical protein
MKKFTLIFILIFAIAFTQTYSQATKKKLGGTTPANTENVSTDKKKVEPAPTPAKTDKKTNKKAAKPMKGTISSVSKIYTGKYSINKAEAQTCISNNDPVVFVVGDGKKAKVYFILESDGSFSGKKLAGYAGNKKIAVFGKAKSVNGMNFIVEEMMESAD